MKKLTFKWVYALVLFGTCLSALGPSVFMAGLLKAEKMNREFSIALFLLFGGLSMMLVYFIDNLINSSKRKIILSIKESVKLASCGLLSAGQFFAFTFAMQLGSVTETTMMVRVSPIMSILMGHYFLNEKVRNWKLLVLASSLCLGGVFFMQDISANSFAQVKVLAMLFGILSALALAGKSVLSSSLTARHHELPNFFVVAISMIIGGLVMLSFVDKSFFIVPNANQISILIFLGIVTIAIPMTINNYAFRVTKKTGAVTYFGFLLPVLGAMAAYFINDERGFDYLKLGLSFVAISIGVYLINKK